jgi:hypothetical protein
MREVDRLKMHIKNHRNDSETKLSSQAHTIRLLSSKSDLHTELTQAHHDLQLEKLLVENLRRDVETYQSMLRVEQSKCARLKKELQDSESAKGKLEILKSLEGVPGIQPAQLIEIFSEKLQTLEAELTKAQSESQKSAQTPSPIKQLTASSLKQSFTEEVRKILAMKQLSDFLPSLSHSLLVQRILDLEMLIQEQEHQIHDLTQELGTRQDPQLIGEDSDFDPSSNGKLLLLSQENLAQARNDVKQLRYQLELSQEREAAANSRLHSISVTKLCASCQNKLEGPSGESFDFSPDLPESDDDEARSTKKENENLKSLLRERTTQVCARPF